MSTEELIPSLTYHSIGLGNDERRSRQAKGWGRHLRGGNPGIEVLQSVTNFAENDGGLDDGGQELVGAEILSKKKPACTKIAR